MAYDYDKFRNHPFIQTIADHKKWTVSTKDKMPIDMFSFKYQDRIAGAAFTNDLSLTTLDEVHSLIPNASNYAFHLDAQSEGVVSLDIEPKCPEDIKNKLKTMPCLYMETSMSGKGIHMWFPLPRNILKQYPDAGGKIVMKEQHGYYEILMTHYVTFTANLLPHTPSDQSPEFEELFKELASRQKTVERADIQIAQIKDLQTPTSSAIISSLLNHKADFRKTPEDYNDDMSVYEFAYISWVNSRLSRILANPFIASRYQYSDSEKAWFLYKTASEFLEPRKKHGETRDGMPWLLYLSREVLAKSKGD